MSNAATNVTVSVATTAPSSAVPAHRAPQPPAPFRAPLTWLAMALFLVSAAQWLAACRRGGHCARPALGLPPGAPLGALRLFIVLCAVVLASMWTLACGGGGSGSSGPPPNPGTPAGTYTLTVTATFTSGSTTLKHNIALTLTVT